MVEKGPREEGKERGSGEEVSVGPQRRQVRAAGLGIEKQPPLEVQVQVQVAGRHCTTQHRGEEPHSKSWGVLLREKRPGAHCPHRQQRVNADSDTQVSTPKAQATCRSWT